MSHLVNDMIMEDIADKIWAKVDNGDEDIWQDMTEIAIERGPVSYTHLTLPTKG